MRLRDIFLRYLLLVLIALPNLFIFYFILTPLTIYPLFLILKLFIKDISLVGNSFIINNFRIDIIGACVAASAYYLLAILNISTPNITFGKRVKMILFSFSLLLFLNISRMFILTFFFISKSSFFDLVHKLFWYLGTTIFVGLIWFIEVKKYKIKDIPIYSDIKFLIKQIKH